VRFGHADGANLLAGTGRRQVLELLLVRAAVRDVGDRHVAMHGQGRRDTAETGARELLSKHDRSERAHAAAPVCFRVPHPQEAERPQFPKHGTWDLALRLPHLGMRRDLLGDEAAHLFADHAQVLVEESRFLELEFGHKSLY
jgi:hypothetical protein